VGHGIFSKAAVGHEVKKVENPWSRAFSNRNFDTLSMKITTTTGIR